MFIFWLSWAENSKIENFAQTLKGGRVIKMLFLECNFILRKSNAVVFRLLAQNHAITVYVYDQSRNEDFGKKKVLSRRNFKNLYKPNMLHEFF